MFSTVSNQAFSNYSWKTDETAHPSRYKLSESNHMNGQMEIPAEKESGH